MLARAQRLFRTAFETTWKRGSTRCGVFVCIRTHYAHDSRFACVAPKKIARRAVDRTHIRRRLRAAIAAVIAQKDVPDAMHVIITAKKRSILDAPFSAIVQEIHTLLSRTHKDKK